MKFKFLAIALFPFALAACQSGDIQNIRDITVKLVQQQNPEKVLADYHWSYQPQNSNKAIVLHFEDKRLSIDSGCNGQRTSWKIENGQIVTSELMSTMMACSPELMKQEQLSASIFQKREIPFTLNAMNAEQPTLTISAVNGEKYIFTGSIKAEAKYQSEGEIIFLEIAPETKQCTGVTLQTCLQVREIKYDAQGVKTQVDKDWTFFYDHIDGFKHNSNERQIVRVKRYEIKNPAADQSKYAYVQDMIIERETIQK